MVVLLALFCEATAAQAEVTEPASQALLRRWLDVQNRADFAGYRGLYAASFRGVRRSGKRAVSFDRDGWLKDRERMFRRPMQVSAAQIRYQATPPTLTFEQTWASGGYRDVGQKRMRLGEEDGQVRITGEELLQSDLRPEPLRPDEDALVRCLFPAYDAAHRKLGKAQVQRVTSVAYGEGGKLALITLSDRELIGVCDAAARGLGSAALPEADSYGEACAILKQGACSSEIREADERRQTGEIKLDGKFLELTPGQWAVAVERHYAADTGTDEGGPGEEFRWATLLAYQVSGGNLTRILTLPYAAQRSDVELSDSFDTTLTYEGPGVLRVERVVRNGVYPDKVRQRLHKSRLRWTGTRLISGR